MIFRGAFVYLCLVAPHIISTNATFSKGRKVKTLGDIVEGSRSQKSLGNQCNLISHTKNSSQVQKQSHVEHQINLNAKNVDIALLAVNKKRNFKEAFENKEAKPAQLPDNVQANVILPHYSTDWGEDLMLFATEWDAFPTYMMESHPAEIQHNFDTALNGLEHSYHDYYLQGSSFWENDPWLIHQPESFGPQSGISVNDAAETQVPEHQNLGESSLADNQPLSSLVETVPTDVSAGTSYSTLASNFGPNQQEKTRALNEKGQSSNEIFESPHMLNLSRDPNIFKKNRPSKAQKDIVEIEDLPFKGKQRPRTLSADEKYAAEKEALLKSRPSSSKAPGGKSHRIAKNIKDHGKKKKKYREKVPPSEKALIDAIDEFKLNLVELRGSSSSKSSLNLFLETMDKIADNKSIEDFPKSRKVINQQYLKLYTQKPYFKSFLANSGIPICQSLLNELQKSIEKSNDEGGKNSDYFFFKATNGQIKRNFDQNLYILPHQVSLFFNAKKSDFKVENIVLEKVPCNWNYYTDHLSKTFCTAIKMIPWKELFISDKEIDLFEKREMYMKYRKLKRFGVDYGRLPSMRFELRKLFRVYSTLINKLFCDGQKDLQENFHDRQKAAISFFDKVISLLEIDSGDNANYFIRNENIRTMFSKHSLKFPTQKFQFKICHGDRSKIDIVWKILTLWLARYKYEYY